MRVFVPRVLALGLALLAVSVALPSLTPAERVRGGNVVMTLDGEVTPSRLPRDRPAPVAATLTSSLSTVDGQPLPRVRRIEVAFGGTSIAAGGLPVCPRARLRNATAAEALARCGGSLVGHGRLSLEVQLPGQLPLQRSPRALVFNGRAGGRPALWIHAFASSPPVSFVLPFHLRRRGGSPASTLVAPVPRSTARWARVTGFEVTLRRVYRWHGRLHSYLSGSCPVPRPFTSGFSSLARVTYEFAGERRLSEVLVRNCRVR